MYLDKYKVVGDQSIGELHKLCVGRCRARILAGNLAWWLSGIAAAVAIKTRSLTESGTTALVTKEDIEGVLFTPLSDTE